MNKGAQTKETILRQALDQASEVGLEGLTVGLLAKRVGMSKSGLYAHFGSKEDLQTQVLDAAADRFVDAVLAPAFKQARGLPRVRALFATWMNWIEGEFSGGCPFLAAAAEFDDRPGPVRDHLVRHLRDVADTIARAAQMAVDEGHFRADLDVQQFAFEFWALLMSLHHYARLMQIEEARTRAESAFGRLIEQATRP